MAPHTGGPSAPNAAVAALTDNKTLRTERYDVESEDLAGD